MFLGGCAVKIRSEELYGLLFECFSFSPESQVGLNVGRAHNEYYEVALKDRYGHYAFDDGKYVDDVDDPNYVYFDQKLNGKWGKTYDNSDNLVD